MILQSLKVNCDGAHLSLVMSRQRLHGAWRREHISALLLVVTLQSHFSPGDGRSQRQQLVKDGQAESLWVAVFNYTARI